MEYIPYTYLLGWSKQNKWYYGVQYGKSRVANPRNLWTTYYTSSKIVKSFRKLHGEPDIIEVRKTFATRQQAVLWEEKVLHRLAAHKDDKWLNKNVSGAVYSTSEERSLAMKKAWVTRRKNGYIPYNRGKPGRVWTEEQRASASAKQKGKKIPAERVARSAAGLRGKPKSEQHRHNLSLNGGGNDLNVYTFKNTKTGELFVGRQREFREKYYPNRPHSSSRLSDLIHGRIKRLSWTWIVINPYEA